MVVVGVTLGDAPTDKLAVGLAVIDGVLDGVPVLDAVIDGVLLLVILAVLEDV
jgi:hypothetical protein